ncbi:MAG: LpxI family protein, partial [Pseudomonadota bacterium]
MPGTHLALIAGRGALPGAVAQAQARVPLIASLQGNAPDGLDIDLTFRIEKLGTFFGQLKAKEVREVCFCGAVTRPEIDPAEIDARTAPMIPTLAAAAAGGEDSALRAILALFEEVGFVVRAAHDLAPSLLPTRGMLTQTVPQSDLADQISLAETVKAEQGAQDLGQACVIRNGDVIAREDTR